MDRITSSPRELAEKLAKARRMAGMTQLHVSRTLGIHRPYVSRMENGSWPVCKDVLVKLAELYNVPLDMLLYTGELRPGITLKFELCGQEGVITSPHEEVSPLNMKVVDVMAVPRVGVLRGLIMDTYCPTCKSVWEGLNLGGRWRFLPRANVPGFVSGEFRVTVPKLDGI